MAKIPQYRVDLDKSLGAVEVVIDYGYQRGGAYLAYLVAPDQVTIKRKMDTLRIEDDAPPILRAADTPADVNDHYLGVRCVVQAVQNDPDGPWSIQCDIYQRAVTNPAQRTHVFTMPTLTGRLQDNAAGEHFFLHFVAA